ncbi:MAG: endonuclease III [Aquificota bacterium]|nr:endonuclease III [Aquificota bacterium]
MVQRKSKGSRRGTDQGAGPLRSKVLKILELLGREYPDPKLELEYDNAFQLLVGAILAAQESDRKVNSIREEFFRKYPDPEAVVRAPLDQLEKDISVINFYRRKAKLIKKCCDAILKEFGGEIPKTVEEMVKLPGVGRKTANMVIGGAFRLPAIIVDRHLLRVSRRIGLTGEEDPDRVELELREVVPREDWTRFSFLLISHGKRICTARDPRCDACVICELCDSCKVKV